MTVLTIDVARAITQALMGMDISAIQVPNHDTPAEQVDWVKQIINADPAQRMRVFRNLFAGHQYSAAIYGEVFSADAEVVDDFDYAKVHLSDTGNAEWFAHQYADKLRFDHLQSRWLYWTGKRWKQDNDGAITRLAIKCARARLDYANKELDGDSRDHAIKWALGSESRTRIQAMTSLSQSLRPLADNGENWDSNGMLLGVENGVVNLRTGELREGHSTDRITMTTKIIYDPDYPCKRWDKFLQEVFVDDDVVSFIQRAVGYSLTGDTREQVIFFCHGQGANGKSTFLDTLRAMLGDYAANTPFSTFDQKNPSAIPNDVAALYKARLVTASETNESRRLNEGRVKAMTGDSAMTARFMHKEFFTYRPQFKIWLAMNHKPTIYGTDDGIWRRIRMIPFSQSFKDNPDKTLEGTLHKELPGILAWGVRGCQMWMSEGLTLPNAIKNATEQYRLESDFIAAFIDEALLVHPSASLKASELYKEYVEWCRPRGDDPMNSTNFGKRLAEKGYEKKRTNHGYYYDGLGLLINNNFMNKGE
jgi:putative DNA primase/helicase